MRRVAVAVVFVLMVMGPGTAKSSRRRRYLIFPPHGSKFQAKIFGLFFVFSILSLSFWFISSFILLLAYIHALLIVGTGVPIPLENHAITMGWVIKSAYLVPTNASEITDSYVTFQKRSVGSVGRKASRYDFYRTFESAAESFGGGGKECMLRTICEASRVPLRASGLVGQIMRVFVLPSATDEVPLSRADLDYHNAELLGKEKDIDCRSVYPSCSFNLFDLLTVIM